MIRPGLKRVKAICEAIKDAASVLQLPLPKLLCEPGRSLIGSACVTAYNRLIKSGSRNSHLRSNRWRDVR
jgi:diaminopimelate decarboxylase